MRIKGLTDEDFLQYKKPSMFIISPFCTFKCDKENGSQYCQNWSLSKAKSFPVKNELIIERYLNNNITKAIVFGGLEPMDTFEEVFSFIETLRNKYKCNDDVVIYTGYTEEEISDKVKKFKSFKNIIVKFGRYRPNQEKHLDPVLQVYLSSDNQYAVKIS